MAHPAGPEQPEDISNHDGATSGPMLSARRGRRWRIRADRVVFGLIAGLAGALAIAAAAGLDDFEIAGVIALPMTSDPAPPSALADGDEFARDEWARADFDGRVRFETERTAILGTAALEQLDYDWKTNLPAWRIEFIEGNDRVAGYTWSQEQRIEVFVRPSASSADVARILAHELGHAVDVSLNSPEERQTWLDQRGAAETTEWWPSSGAADFETGAGDFAESFAVWLVGPDDYRSVVAPAPSPTDLDLIARLAA